MSGAEIVALVSVVMTAGVSPYIAARFASRAARQTARLQREDELRSVLDAAGIRITEALIAFEDAEAEAARGSVPYRTLEALQTQLEQVEMNQVRLAVRIGHTAPETQAYRSAKDRLRSTLSELKVGDAEVPHEDSKTHRAWAQDYANGFFDCASMRIGPDAVENPSEQSAGLLSRLLG